MGIQLHANKKDLLKAGFTFEVVETPVWDVTYEGDEYIARYRSNAVWQSPCGKRMWSYTPDSLCFDNKNANHDLREILDKYNVPYVRS